MNGTKTGFSAEEPEEINLGPWDDSLRYDIVPYTRGFGLEVDPPETDKAYPQFVRIDPGQIGMFADNVVSFVVLRGDSEVDVSECWRIIKYDGHLVFCDCEELQKKMGGLKGWVILEDSKRLYVAKKVLAGQSHKLAMDGVNSKKTVCVVRYGAIGDIVQTASILAALKKQGYYTVLNTHTDSHEIIKHDPNVDHFILQDQDQVPNEELSRYWDHMRGKFDRYINLSESVEGTFLALPGRTPYYWPNKVRQEMLNHNYLEFMHLLADVPYDPKPRFYPTSTEKKWAAKQKKKFGGTVIMWLLGGSSVHKTWPHLDQTIAKLMVNYPDIRIVTAGDELCKVLEISWENEPRVIRRSGVWSKRESLTFAEYADIVIGPETGILNAVSHLDVPKIVTMSHSSPKNLTRDWKRCISLVPEFCACYPCHMMHYGFDYCNRDEETGVALCQARIPADKMMQAIEMQLGRIERKVA